MNSAVLEADVPSAEAALERARALLCEALYVLDAAGTRPDLGARLQHVIDELSQDGER